MTETRVCLYCCRERPSWALYREPGFYVVWRCRDEEDCKAVRAAKRSDETRPAP